MATRQLRMLLGRLEQLAGGPREPHETDGQLLDDFSARHDERAFAELVARHGPLVLRVCRRVLHHEQDAEDAFQATFLVLAQNLGSIRKREALADWLHGVAYRTAMKAKRNAARRHQHEAHLREQTPARAASPTWDDVQAVLDEEIQRLPAVYRSAFVLCVLEGKTIAAVAVEVGCKDGTVASRLARARQRLQKQLARRGIKLVALLAALGVAESVSKAAVPGALAHTVIRNGLLVAAGGSAAGTIPSHVAALATGVTRAMFIQKAKIAVVVLLTLGLFAAGAGVLTQQLLKAEEKPAVAQPAVKLPAEPAKPAEDGIKARGRVLDPDGKPVANARLYQPRWFTIYPTSSADFEMVSLGTADSEGRFRVKLPRPSAKSGRPFTLIAAADGFGLNWIELSETDKPDEVTLRLVKDQIVRGRLVNTEGKPVAGVSVEIYSLWTAFPDRLGKPMDKLDVIYAPLHKVVRVSATDQDGHFEITGLGAERAVIVALKSAAAAMPAFTIVTHDGYDPKRQAPTERNQMFPLPCFGPAFECAVLPTRALEGTVREAGSGKPVVGAVVEASENYDFAVRAVTDSKGHYQLVGLRKVDKYHVKVTPGKMAPYLTRSVEVADRPGLETVTCDVELSRGVLVTGRVFDKITGKGVVSAVSCVALPDNQFAAKFLHSREVMTWTDTEGRFSLVTIPGPSVLLVDMQIILDKIGGSGNVVPYMQAEFDEADRKRVKVVENRRPEFRDTVLRSFTDAGGNMVYLNRKNACKVVDLKEDAGPVACDLTVNPGKTLTINLEDSNGKPLVGAIAAGVDAMGNMVWRLKTAACPVYALDPKQPRQVAFLHPETKLAAVVTLRGDDKEPYMVRLKPTGTITGRLLAPEGQPLAGASIHLSESYPGGLAERVSKSMRQPPIDKDGRFRLEGLLPGIKVQFYVVKGKDIFVEASKTNREAPKAGTTLDLGDIRVKARTQ